MPGKPRFLIDCRHIQEQQSRMLDGDLGLWDRILVRIHCAMCTYCRRFGEQIGMARGFLREFPEKHDFAQDAKLDDDAKSRIAARLTEKSKEKE